MPAERTTMRQVREVLRLKFVGGVPTREIAGGITYPTGVFKNRAKRPGHLTPAWRGLRKRESPAPKGGADNPTMVVDDQLKREIIETSGVRAVRPG